MLSVAWSVWVSEGLLGSKDPGPSSAVSGVPHHTGRHIQAESRPSVPDKLIETGVDIPTTPVTGDS